MASKLVRQFLTTEEFSIDEHGVRRWSSVEVPITPGEGKLVREAIEYRENQNAHRTMLEHYQRTGQPVSLPKPVVVFDEQ